MPGTRAEANVGSGSSPSHGSSSIAATVDRFVAVFNDGDLAAVMEFFADDAVYCPGDGRTVRGRAAIREIFRPQFDGIYGEMFFAVRDVLVDQAARKAAIRWVCHHDLTGAKGRRIPVLQRLLYRLLYGRRFGWWGNDVFHFDAEGRITAKYTYASYKRPLVRRDLARSVR